MDRTRVFRQAEELQFTCEMKNWRTHNTRVQPGINDVKIGHNSWQTINMEKVWQNRWELPTNIKMEKISKNGTMKNTTAGMGSSHTCEKVIKSISWNLV
jgi:hypothetical protein